MDKAAYIAMWSKENLENIINIVPMESNIYYFSFKWQIGISVIDEDWNIFNPLAESVITPYGGDLRTHDW